MPNSDLTLEKMKIDERLRGVELHVAASNVIFTNLTKAIDALTEKIGNQNGRIGRLENDRAWVLGAFAVVLIAIKLIGH